MSTTIVFVSAEMIVINMSTTIVFVSGLAKEDSFGGPGEDSAIFMGVEQVCSYIIEAKLPENYSCFSTGMFWGSPVLPEQC